MRDLVTTVDTPVRSIPTGDARRLLVAVLLFFLGSCATPTWGQVPPSEAPATQAPTVWRVGTKEAPPFSFRDEDGEWQGMAIELWRACAERLGVESEFVEHDSVSDLLAAVESGDVRIGVGAITVNAERERAVDFSHPLAPAALGIVTRASGDSGFGALARAVFSIRFVQAMLTLVVVLFITGAIMWFVERRANAEQFDPRPLRGLGDGFWWSGVTMTTVGYGDKAPRTATGRLIALGWMFASIVLISGLTGAIASALTVDRLGSAISGVDDLRDVRVGVLDGSAAEARLNSDGVRTRDFADADAALAALGNETIDAFVNDLPVLHWSIERSDVPGLVVLAERFGRGWYSFALPQRSADLDALDTALLEVTDSGELDDSWDSYLGE